MLVKGGKELESVLKLGFTLASNKAYIQLGCTQTAI